MTPDYLSIQNSGLTAAGLQHVAEVFPAIDELRVSDNPIGPEGIGALINARLPALKRLDLSNCNLDDTAFAILVNSALFAQLEALDVRENALTREGVTESFASSSNTLRPLMKPELRSAWDLARMNALGNPDEYDGDLTLATNADIRHARLLRRVRGSLLLTGSLKSLKGLRRLEEVTGQLVIAKTEIKSLSGLDALASVGGDLVIENNPMLRKVSGLAGLRSVGGKLTLQQLDVGRIAGFNRLASVGGDFQLRSLPALTAIVGFGALTEVGGTVEIEQVGRLRRFSGLSALARVGGDVRFCFPGGESIRDGLQSLAQVNGKIVTACEETSP